MNNTLRLLKIHLGEIFSLKRMKAKKETGKFAMLAVSFALVGLIFLFYLIIISIALISIGLADYLLPTMMLLTSLVTLFMMMFKSNGFLFGAKDTEILMAMPIKNESITFSRIFAMYLFELPFTVGIMLPAFIIHCIMVPSSPLFYLFFLLSLPLVPVVPIIIATFLGALIAFITSRFKYSNILNIVITIAFLIGFLVLFYNPANFAFLENIESISGDMFTPLLETLLAVYPLAGVYKLFLGGNIVAFIGFAALSVLLAYLFVKLLSKVYLKTLTAINSHKSKSNYQLKELKSSSPVKAFYFKELKRYFSSSGYVVNTATGGILLIVLAVVLCFVPQETIQQFGENLFAANMIGKILPLVSCMMIGISTTTSSSLSLEGKNMWIPQTLPVASQTVFQSKVCVSLTVTLPAVAISGILFIVSGYLDIAGMFLVFVAPSAFSIFMAYFGIFLNYYNLKLDWTNEITVIKQSMPMMVTVFVGMFAIMLMIPFVAMMPDTVALIFMIGFSAVALLLAWMLHKIISNKPLVRKAD